MHWRSWTSSCRSATGSAARLLAATIACLAVAGSVAATTATAKTYGVVPPRNPVGDCAHSPLVTFTVKDINHCRSRERIGPLRLPSNWSKLGPGQQMFVLVNLERIARGLPPLIGLSAPLNRLAAAAAANATDPAFPAGSAWGGSVWAGDTTVIGADEAWMYDDGPHGLDLNLDCTTPSASGCWGHRDILLMRGNGGPLVAGAGYSQAPGYPSESLEILCGFGRSRLTFTWAGELRYFARRPRAEPLRS